MNSRKFNMLIISYELDFFVAIFWGILLLTAEVDDPTVW